MLLNNLSIYSSIVIDVPFKSINLIEEKLHETDRLYSSSPIMFDYSTETYSTESSFMEQVCLLSLQTNEAIIESLTYFEFLL